MPCVFRAYAQNAQGLWILYDENTFMRNQCARKWIIIQKSLYFQCFFVFFIDAPLLCPATQNGLPSNATKALPTRSAGTSSPSSLMQSPLPRATARVFLK